MVYIMFSQVNLKFTPLCLVNICSPTLLRLCYVLANYLYTYIHNLISTLHSDQPSSHSHLNSSRNNGEYEEVQHKSNSKLGSTSLTVLL